MDISGVTVDVTVLIAVMVFIAATVWGLARKLSAVEKAILDGQHKLDLHLTRVEVHDKTVDEHINALQKSIDRLHVVDEKLRERLNKLAKVITRVITRCEINHDEMIEFDDEAASEDAT